MYKVTQRLSNSFHTYHKTQLDIYVQIYCFNKQAMIQEKKIYLAWSHIRVRHYELMTFHTLSCRAKAF